MGGAFAPRTLLGSLGVPRIPGAAEPIMGERLPLFQTVTTAIPANTTAVVTVDFQLPTVNGNDAAWIENLAGIVIPVDNSEKLQIVAYASGFMQGLSVPAFFFQVIGTLGLLPATASAFVGFFIQPPPPGRPRDFSMQGTAANPMHVFIKISFKNTDVGAPQSATVTASGMFRIFGGVSN